MPVSGVAVSRRTKQKPNADISTFGNQNEGTQLKESYAALTTLPDLMQRVQTFIRLLPPFGSWTRTGCKFGLKRRRVLLFACETLLPNCGPLPHISHRWAILLPQIREDDQLS